MRAVLLVNGGEFVLKQIPDYVQNVIAAHRAGQNYQIIAVDGVGGASAREVFEPAVKAYLHENRSDPDIAALIDQLENGPIFCPWLNFVNSGITALFHLLNAFYD